MSIHTKIKLLHQSTNHLWLQQALNNLDIILLDHSHCERKAAGVAVNLLFRYPSHEKLIHQLTGIAKEELEHFEQVNQWLQKKGISLAPLKPSPYGATLKEAIRRHEPHRLLDSLLVSALIEARSHERLGLLADNCQEEDLAKFYRGLMASEARHYGIYWILATEYFDRVMVDERLQELAQLESNILSNLHPEPRIHS
ncbi:tRNA-(ms[2]io[6]A)-hydroxylase [Geminocystis sp. NIES-3709]|uniref:tRNA-(ms[2]io[6]A)-hydroxylase n=1 Tax=Geminocystis sp. NIES-3709 TaxID=1617448 RepID=UPI0005FC4B78|nr:tRNA isopentenyl-2-thiomethyl-A-37 hydroxylase MiaE [Geminocystis sp. NIES-3709]BAQ64448.1 tRNA-(ms[2]io[6]A)-hydroxylase [Geminocystis sp. NIES-3709]